MSLSLDDVSRIARLARIEISPAEAERTRDQLNGILAFVEQLQAVNTDGIAPLAHAVDVVQRLRPDTVTESDHRDAFQAIAPETEAGLYLVPKVIE
jgi:aspartyl-tRNA(Asn)/glutamyl-tRNA(Gln) amidotransferase subunit C